MNYIFDRIDSSSRLSSAKEIMKRNVVHQLFGVDISPKLTKIAKANMLLGKDGHGGIEHANSLDSISKLSAKFNELCGLGKPSIILTNPPFGAGHDLRIKEGYLLTQYQAGHQWELGENGTIVYSNKLNDRMGVAPELLFLEKCLEWVKEDGIIGIVMAKGQLDNREALAVRKIVCQKAQILAVVNLHEDTFEPFCGSKASVIFLKKTSRPPSDYRIFMAISNKVGQTSRGETIFKKDAEGNPIIRNGQHVLDEDLSEIAESYMMLVDLQGLLGAIQNLITAINSDFMNFYIQLTTIGEDSPSFETGTTWTSGYHCSIVFSLLTSYFTKAHSILDILTKLVHEFDKDPGTYSGLEKLRSKGILFGNRKWLSIDKVPNTVFDDSKKNCVYEIESLRNELVHNGTWEALEKVYIETQNGRIIKRFIFWPDFRENRLAVSGNRNKFFSSGKTVNEELLRIHVDLLKRLEYTLSYIKHHFAESLPDRSFEEIMKMNISDAKQQIQSYYRQA